MEIDKSQWHIHLWDRHAGEGQLHRRFPLGKSLENDFSLYSRTCCWARSAEPERQDSQCGVEEQ